LVLFIHGSILSKVGASSKPGAIQLSRRWLNRKLTPENCSIYGEFSRFRNASLWNRLAGLYRTRLHRQTLGGNITPVAGCIIQALVAALL
ncbi:MAG TPA: hypothetical protein PK667_11980, partial [Nitrosomonas europaea]|nr:hypothetical protein [Nitrosomonas europaea]HRO57256.1 hypothetical protein [Nitrosomonas europaea]HRQ09078.1 hypothetical protein [Nitrosomonas europaea]HUM74889.1 hypothetical protein [Nitrosomonas europaea]